MITVKNIKNGPIPINNNSLCIIFTSPNNGTISDLIPIFGNINPADPVHFNIFNSTQIDKNISETLGHSYFFGVQLDNSITTPTLYQLQIDIWYTIAS